MKLFRISQTQNDGWDTYDSAIVAAMTEVEASKINPSEYGENWQDGKENNWQERDGWALSPDAVLVEYLGEAKEGTLSGVILASFNPS